MERFSQIILIFNIFLLISTSANAHTKSVFVFGDSLFDPGNNRYVKNCTVQARVPPYGSTFFLRPTGRFTNGRTVADFIATYLEIKFQGPYQQQYGASLISPIGKLLPVPPNGINFASAGSGILPGTNKYAGVTPVPEQLEQFEGLFRYKHLHKNQTKKSMFFLAVGSNDIFTFSQDPKKAPLPPIAYANAMLEGVKRFLDKIYKHGARKIVLFSVGPMGCIPGHVNLPNATANTCHAGANKMAKYYNAGLERLAISIPRRYRGAIGVYAETFNTAEWIRRNPKLHGFENVKEACCGAGILNGQLQCGERGYKVCLEPKKFFFWDYFHPTEHTYEIIAKTFWSGGRHAIRPMNLKILAKIKLRHHS